MNLNITLFSGLFISMFSISIASDKEEQAKIVLSPADPMSSTFFADGIDYLNKEFNPYTGDFNLIQNKTFKNLFKPLLTRTLISDKGFIKLGSGFALEVDNDALKVSANYSNFIKKEKNIILSAGLNTTIDPDNQFTSIFQDGKANIDYGFSFGFTKAYNNKSISYTNNLQEFTNIKSDMYSALLKELQSNNRLLVDYKALYSEFSALKDDINGYIEAYMLSTPFNPSQQIPRSTFNPHGKAALNNYISSFGFGASPNIQEWLTLRSKLEDTLDGILKHTAEIIPDPTAQDYKDYVLDKVVDYEVKNINRTTSGFRLTFIDFKVSFNMKRYTTINADLIRSSTLQNLDSIGNLLQFKYNEPVVTFSFSPLNYMRLTKKRLTYFSGNLKYSFTNTFALLDDDKKQKVQAVYERFNADSSRKVNEIKEYQGFDVNKHSFKYLHTLDLTFYHVHFFGEKKVAGFENTIITSFRPKVKNLINQEAHDVKLDLSIGAVFSIPTKSEGKTDDDKSIINFALLFNFKDVANSDANYTETSDTDPLDKFINRFGIGFRVGIPINKIIL